ncbi:putative disease resistance protein RGA4 isoform X2 [Castanea sativa]|uniref:putative disease resistance protein RGA4 isoform X2 n=1 Tax=Castanea sativa TaxID=21020 RepID=UPI003F64B0D5
MARALVSAIAKELGSIIASDLRLTVSVKEEVQKLESKFRTIQAVLNDAEKRQLKDEAVKLWLDKPKDVSYEMDDVLDEWNTAMIKADIKKQEKEEEEKKRKLKLVLLRRGSLFLTDKEDKINLKEETPSRTSRIQLRKEMNMILTPPLTKEIEEDDASQIYYMSKLIGEV